jgi:hypothetical protein
MHPSPPRLVVCNVSRWGSWVPKPAAVHISIQCHEAAKFVGDMSNSFDEILGEWKKFNKKGLES